MRSAQHYILQDMPPNGVTDEQFKNLRRYFGGEQIVELVSIIAFFGFLNR
jgi:alkylhydroperoxidase family enzyme